MFRRQIKRGIRAVESGEGPPGLRLAADAITPTYCNDTVVRMLPAATAVEDRRLMRETGRQLAETYLALVKTLAVCRTGVYRTVG
jgi:hypothetical protein